MSGVHAWIQACSCVFRYRCAFVHKFGGPSLTSGISFDFTTLYSLKQNQSNPELADTVSLAIQLALNNSFLCLLWVGTVGRPPSPPGIYLDSVYLNSGPHT